MLLAWFSLICLLVLVDFLLVAILGRRGEAFLLRLERLHLVHTVYFELRNRAVVLGAEIRWEIKAKKALKRGGLG